MSVSAWVRHQWSVAAAVVVVAGSLMAMPGIASAAGETDLARTAIAAKYDALGGSAGTLGAVVGELACDGDSYPYECVQDYERGAISWGRYLGTFAVTDGAVLTRWAASGAEPVYRSIGAPTTDTFCGLAGGGCGQHFERGSVYWSPAAGRALFVSESARYVWGAQGWERGPLGLPVTEMSCTLRDSGCLQRFAGGVVYSSSVDVHAVIAGPVGDRWAAQGWENGPLSYPTSEVFCGLQGGGCGQHFRGGSIYSTPAGTFAVTGNMYTSWAGQGWERGVLGYPVGEQFATASAGVGQHFQNGSIYTSFGQTFVIPNPVRDLWGARGWERGRLNEPASQRFCGLRDGGCGQHFWLGSVYTSRAGTFAVLSGVIRDRWAAQGWENGPLGYPIGEEFVGLSTRGQAFEGGSLYSGDGTFYVVPRAFMSLYAAQGWERGPLSVPASEMFCGLRDGGCGQHFRNGSIYSSPAGTYAVLTGTVGRTDIRSAWADAGWENGSMGYPTGPVFCGLRDGGCGQHFQGGSIYRSAYSSLSGVAIPTPVRDAWAAQGWENGRLGYPTGPAYGVPGGIAQPFSGGTLTVR